MLRVTEIRLPLDHTEEHLRRALCRALRIRDDDLKDWTVRRRSVDARKLPPCFSYTIDAAVSGENEVLHRCKNVSAVDIKPYRFPDATPSEERPVVVGAGPCGLFAALMLARAGLRPILIERGKPAKERARDAARFWRTGQLDPSSNVLFGEGGAGTFSDGKLVTQIKDRHGRCRQVLTEFVQAGAPEEILFQAKPHIGTDLLIKVVGNLRHAIEENGGTVRFNCRLTDILIEDGCVRGVQLNDSETLETEVLILAIGHSARDTFSMLEQRGASMAPKPFSIGLRIEHPQSLINRAQYGKYAKHPKLGAAEYRLSHHCSNGRSVYSFCMCPGGKVIAAASEPGQVVTNGMSYHSRREANANSGLLVGIKPADFGGTGVLAGVEFQRKWERKAFELGGGGFKAPVQLSADFLAGQVSVSLGSVQATYRPGVELGDLSACLPDYAVLALREAIPVFDRKLRGFGMPDAVLTGVESRSSSPVRVLRNESLESENIRGLFPAGEGAGYAGGIISAAVDGIRCAEAAAGRYPRGCDGPSSKPY